MKGSIKERYPGSGSWTLIFDEGSIKVTDPVTGEVKTRRRQRWVTLRGTEKQAQTRLRELCGQVDTNQYVPPCKLSVAEWFDEWLGGTLKARIGREKGIRQSTYDLYRRIYEAHIQRAPLGSVKLQRWSALDTEQYLTSLDLATKSIELHRTLLSQAWKAAKRKRLVAGDDPVKGAVAVGGVLARKSRQRAPSSWSALEAQRFLLVAKSAGSQAGAFYTLLLDSGMRKGEALGLAWRDVDLDAGTITISRQRIGPTPDDVGPTKTGKPRTIDLGAGAVAALSVHKKQQARPFGLVFTREDGSPLSLSSTWEFGRLTKAAGVKPIRLHDLRHTCASLLLAAGEPLHLVADRLGHANPAITLRVYAHVPKGEGKGAARTIDALLHGGKGAE